MIRRNACSIFEGMHAAGRVTVPMLRSLQLWQRGMRIQSDRLYKTILFLAHEMGGGDVGNMQSVVPVLNPYARVRGK